MKRSRIATVIVILAVATGLFSSRVATAASPAGDTAQTGLVQDVALQEGGVFNGSLVDGKGSPISAANLTLLRDNNPLSVAKTDQQGKFAFKGLQGGIYQLTAPNTFRVYRLWAEGTSPKNASQVAHVVAGQDVARGQTTAGRVKKIITSPLGITAIVATAIAVPVALHNSDRGSAH